jgi:hypothetical protein
MLVVGCVALRCVWEGGRVRVGTRFLLQTTLEEMCRTTVILWWRFAN